MNSLARLWDQNPGSTTYLLADRSWASYLIFLWVYFLIHENGKNNSTHSVNESIVNHWAIPARHIVLLVLFLLPSYPFCSIPAHRINHCRGHVKHPETTKGAFLILQAHSPPFPKSQPCIQSLTSRVRTQNLKHVQIFELSSEICWISTECPRGGFCQYVLSNVDLGEEKGHLTSYEMVVPDLSLWSTSELGLQGRLFLSGTMKPHKGSQSYDMTGSLHHLYKVWWLIFS